MVFGMQLICAPQKQKSLVSVYRYSISQVHISNPCAWEVEVETSEVQDGTDGILQGWRTSEGQGSSPQTEGYWAVGSATLGLWGDSFACRLLLPVLIAAFALPPCWVLQWHFLYISSFNPFDSPGLRCDYCPIL